MVLQKVGALVSPCCVVVGSVVVLVQDDGMVARRHEWFLLSVCTYD